jgi:hypothetical protein
MFLLGIRIKKVGFIRKIKEYKYIKVYKLMQVI